MRYLRLIALLILILALILALTGCGGGGGNGASTRTVTVTVRWPSASRHVTRANLLSVKLVTVEAYDGTVRVGYTSVSIAAGSTLAASTATLTVPAKALTFYANGYATPAAGQTDPTTYQTDPTTGQPAHYTPPATYTPLNTTTDPHPLAHAVTVKDLSQSASLTFTMNNTIASITPVSTAATTFTLGLSGPPNQVVIPSLFSTVQAADATGAIVIADPTELTWSLDTTDTLAAHRVTLTSSGQLTLLAAGTVRVIVQDNAVNPATPNPGVPIPPITATIGYTIVDPAAVTLKIPLTLLQPVFPLYAQSVKFTVTELSTPVGDSPPTTTQPVIAPVTFNPNATPRSVTINGGQDLTTSFTFTGHQFYLTVEAWSNPGGKGVLIAQTVSKTFASPTDSALTVAGSAYTYNQPLFPASDYKIAGFSIAPSTATIYSTNGVTVSTLPTTVTLQATLMLPGPVSTNQTVDSRTLTWVSSGPAAVVTDGLVTSNQAVTAPTPVTITATDRFTPTPIMTTLSGLASTVTVQNTGQTLILQ